MKTTRRAAIIGVTGFLGQGLPALLAGKDMAVTGISRQGSGTIPGVDRWQGVDAMDFTGHDVIINLAGEPINQRWSESAKRKFHDSRARFTGRVVETIARLPEEERPKVLVNASAIGIYGDRGNDPLTELSRAGSGYIPEMCKDWEHAAQDARTLGLRVVCLRIGIVLGREGGSFQELRKIFRLGLGGPLGSGEQWFSWIHVEDLRAAIVHAVFSENLSGPVNGTAPWPERNKDFSKKLGRALHRPAVIGAPAFALKLVLGEFGGVLLESQRVIPETLEKDGFIFRFPRLDAALADLAG